LLEASNKGSGEMALEGLVSKFTFQFLKGCPATLKSTDGAIVKFDQESKS
jgi:hypothetical protein